MEMEEASPRYRLFVGIDIAATTATVAWQGPGGRVGRAITIEQSPAASVALSPPVMATPALSIALPDRRSSVLAHIVALPPRRVVRRPQRAGPLHVVQDEVL
jgi:hypothetical protein